MNYYDAVIQISDILDNLLDDELIYIYNDIVSNLYNYEYIYRMEEMRDYFSGWDVEDLINLGTSGFDSSDKYFYINDVYGETSFSYLSDVINIGEMAEYLLQNEDNYNNDDIADIIDDYYNSEVELEDLVNYD